jgi:hypothetical protein
VLRKGLDKQGRSEKGVFHDRVRVMLPSSIVEIILIKEIIVHSDLYGLDAHDSLV